MQQARAALWLGVLLAIPGFVCADDTASALQRTASELPASHAFVPPNGRILLAVGQDARSIADYVRDCSACPTPAGVTTYLGFYDLLSAAAKFGGLGEDTAGHPTTDADWGAGSASAARMRSTYTKSALIVGLDISNARRRGGLKEITQGKHDDKIRRLAKFFRATQQPIYLRVGYEFDGVWNEGYEARETYVAAYRRIVDILRSSGVRNVAFVWQASASPIDDLLENGTHETLRDWYPGAAYVDWVALSWFLPPDANPRSNRTKVPTQRELAAEVLTLARAEHKPVMIAEATPQGYDLQRLTRANISPIWDGAPGADVTPLGANDIWNQWYRPLFSFIAANRDVIAAFAYINAHWDAQPMWGRPYAHGYWGDSRIQVDPTIKQHWLDEITGPAWLHGGPSLFATLEKQ